MKPASRFLAAVLTVTWLLGAAGAARASTTDIANAPMASSSSSVVKPNILFTLDDSGSMSWTFLPDDANNFYGRYGYVSSQCNGVYYNPAITYLPPMNWDGTSYPNATFTSAYTDGFNQSNTSPATVDLSSKFIINQFVPEQANSWYYSFKSYKNTQSSGAPAYYYTYSGVQTTKAYSNTKSAFYTECNTAIGDTSTKSTDASGKQVLVSTLFTKHVVNSTSGPGGTDERQNFANWYSYYRTRMLMMKTSASRAFASIGDSYRVGYLTINNNTGSDYLNVDDFNNTQKQAWYTRLFAAVPYNGTPLRSALSTAGLIYAGQLNGNTLNKSTVNDPIQYSCQQNFTILSTDGYWNDGNDSGCSSRSGDGCKLDRKTAVGDQDSDSAVSPPPMLDALTKKDTLADVARYYYLTDLRTSDLSNCIGALGTGTDVCENNVPGSGLDKSAQQHMTTFTLGLGLSGTLQYSEDYLSGGSTDYNAIKQGTKNWPDPTLAEGPARIDDLWHAAVNGNGTYFSAANPDSLVSGLSKALAGVSARTGSAAAAATSNLQPVPGDNYAYVALYRTVDWDGDLQARTIDPSTGDVSTASTWAAQPLLDSTVSATSDTRTIYTFDGNGSNKLKSFTWASLTSTEQGYFNDMCATTSKLSQCANLSSSQQTAASGANLANFIRGQNGFENRSVNANPLYRSREHVLSDMINSQPVYVKLPPFNYADTNYATFRDSTEKNRVPMVYVAANDGMLHAFSGDNGTEQWAYIPPAVMPNLYKLADMNYSANHQYYVDGSPTVGDICPNAPGSTCSANQWKTILVGGLNAGGRGYYALDITDPANPKGLWNFSVSDDQNLGYTFGNPIITKRKDGTWVVVFTSGYNNVDPGDGKGYLYVLNANTGELLLKVGDNTGDTTTPSGLGKINAWVDTTTSNTAARFYGGDMLGNVWRFDIDDNVPPVGTEALLLAQLGQIGGAGMQPVTTKPELTQITVGGAVYAVVNVGTGRYLGTSDLSDKSVQSVYALKDNLSATGLGLVRTSGVLVQQTLTTLPGDNTRTTSANSVDWATKSGWYVDLPSQGERVNVDMQQQLGVLTVVGNVPNANACNLGGYAWLYNLDYKTGQFLQSSDGNIAGVRLSNNALVAGIKTVELNTGKISTIVTDTGGGIFGNDGGGANASSAGDAKRMSWRELID